MIKYVFEAMRMNEINIEQMEYLFLRRKRSSAVSERQKNLLFKAAQRHWEEEFVGKEANIRKVDCRIYKAILYQLEIRQIFLDTSLSLKKLSDLLETNQTYLSNVVNKYFGCNLKELVNGYRVEYAKELLSFGRCALNDFVVAVSLLKALSIQLSVRLRVCHLCLISHGKGGNGNYR